MRIHVRPHPRRNKVHRITSLSRRISIIDGFEVRREPAKRIVKEFEVFVGIYETSTVARQ
jgi:hypothetical protein